MNIQPATVTWYSTGRKCGPVLAIVNGHKTHLCYSIVAIVGRTERLVVRYADPAAEGVTVVGEIGSQWIPDTMALGFLFLPVTVNQSRQSIWLHLYFGRPQPEPTVEELMTHYRNTSPIINQVHSGTFASGAGSHYSVWSVYE